MVGYLEPEMPEHLSLGLDLEPNLESTMTRTEQTMNLVPMAHYLTTELMMVVNCSVYYFDIDCPIERLQKIT